MCWLLARVITVEILVQVCDFNEALKMLLNSIINGLFITSTFLGFQTQPQRKGENSCVFSPDSRNVFSICYLIFFLQSLICSLCMCCCMEVLIQHLTKVSYFYLLDSGGFTCQSWTGGSELLKVSKDTVFLYKVQDCFKKKS